MNRAAAAVLLFVGLLLVSTAGPFLVSAHMDAFAVAFWRLAGGAVVFFAWALVTRQLRASRADLLRTAAGGVLLATHFALWIWAFDLTDYASNLLLLVAEPIAAAVIGIPLGERPTKATWISALLAFAGLLTIGGHDVSLGPKALLGDGLSIVSCVAIALFYALTREARRRTPLACFMTIALTAGALSLVPLLALAHTRLTGWPNRSWGWLAALVLITTVAGHGVMNFVARHVKLFTLNVVIVLEPVVGVGLGALLFGATIAPVQIAGGTLLAFAVVVGLLPEWRAAAPPQEDPGVVELEGVQ